MSTTTGNAPSIWTGAFWKGSAERAIRTVAQSGITSLGVVAVAGGGLTEVVWATAGSIAGLAGLLSLLTSIAANAKDGTGPSLLPTAEIATSATQDQLPASAGMPYAAEHPDGPVDADGDGRDDGTGRFVKRV